MAARSSSTVSCAMPEICSTLTSRAPGTSLRMAAAASAYSFNRSRSGPKILTARSLLTPEISSLTRRAIGCENERRSPGIAESSLLIASTSSCLSRPVFQSLRGFSMMKTSLCSGPIGSSEISARPVLVTTVATSGKRMTRFSISCAITTEPSSEAFGSRTTLIAIAPSSRVGMNSIPRNGRNPTDSRSTSTAIPMVSLRAPHRPLEESEIAVVEAPDETELPLPAGPQDPLGERRDDRHRDHERRQQREQERHAPAAGTSSPRPPEA